MAKKKTAVTNAMRILKKLGVPFEEIEYEAGEIGDSFGEKIAEITGLDPDISFKTLTARGDRNGVIVACIPVNRELDLKKLAAVSGDKRAELAHVKELFELTGYIRGGVSPIGMKKKYPTYVDASALSLDKLAVSGGVCGVTLLMTPPDLKRATDCVFADITRNGGGI